MLSSRFPYASAFFVLALYVSFVCGCDSTEPAQRPSSDKNVESSSDSTAVNENVGSDWQPERVDSDHLPNAYRLTEKVISGGLPEDADAFQELANLGVKTIISVDGAQPDIELAHRFGLRYVHLPHGYDGVPESRAEELAKAVLELDGPIYIHCHHGKHRSPAAATVACVGAGFLSPNVAINVLQTAGTSEHYKGLYASAREAHPFDRLLLEQLSVEFAESVKVPPMAEAMVEIEHTFDRLKLVRESNWQVPERHPDVVPAHEALMLREHFTELLRTKEVDNYDANFRSLLQQSEQAAENLEGLLRETGDGRSLSDIKAAYESLASDCKSCHRQYRDAPRSAARK